jgi:hypothetical protein
MTRTTASSSIDSNFSIHEIEMGSLLGLELFMKIATMFLKNSHDGLTV